MPPRNPFASRESRLKRRNLDMILFSKGNRRLLPRKRSSGDTDTHCGHGVRVGVECGAIGKVSSH